MVIILRSITKVTSFKECKEYRSLKNPKVDYELSEEIDVRKFCSVGRI